jgi:hypothetical protein
MAKRRSGEGANREDFIREIEDRQRNIVWPGPLVNARLVDKLVWKGSPDATAVQRVGIAIFGLSFLLVGSVLLSFAKADSSPVVAVIAYLSLLLGGTDALQRLSKAQNRRIAQAIGTLTFAGWRQGDACDPPPAIHQTRRRSPPQNIP